MIEKLWRKEIAVTTVLLLLGVPLASSMNVNINDENPEDITSSDSEENTGITSIIQVHQVSGTTEIVKTIPKWRVETILKYAKDIDLLFESKPSREAIQEKITYLAAELKNADILPHTINTNNAVHLMMDKPFILKQFQIPAYNKNIPSGNSEEHYNNLSFIFGISQNRSDSFPLYKTMPLIAVKFLMLILLGKIDVYEEDFFYILDLICTGPLATLYFQQSKRSWFVGGWMVRSGYASLTSLGLQGIKTIKDKGYGAYVMGLIGFRGITVHFGSLGGFITGFSFFSRIAYTPRNQSTNT